CAASLTQGRVDHGEGPVHADGSVRAGSDANAASNAADFADPADQFARRLADATDRGALADVLQGDYVARASSYAQPAAGAQLGVHMGQALLAHGDGAERTGPGACAEPEAAVDAAFRPFPHQVRRTAVKNPFIQSAVRRQGRCASAPHSRYLPHP